MWAAPRPETAPAWTTSATVWSGWRRWPSPHWTPRERRSHPVTLYERHGERSFDRPVLVVALDGWVDAGLGADGAITALLSADSTELVATFDGEALIDQRARRPVVHISHGVNEGLTWPVIQMRAGTDRLGADICYLVGPEPDFRWPSFVTSVVSLANQLGVR